MPLRYFPQYATPYAAPPVPGSQYGGGMLALAESDQGEQGWPGPQGVPGVQGERGAAGSDGEPGDDGLFAHGLQGMVGEHGLRGAPGLDADNEDGSWPVPGPRGSDGAQGLQGRPGMDGEEGGGDCWPMTTRESLALVPGVHVQAWSAELDAIVALTPGTEEIYRYDNSGILELTACKDVGASVLGGATFAEIREIIGAGEGTAFPSAPNEGEKFYRTDLEHQFYYDSSRTKWLGVELIHVDGVISGTPAANLYFDMPGLAGVVVMETNNAGHQIPYDTCVVAMHAYKQDTNGQSTIRLRRNAVNVAGVQFAAAADNHVQSNTINAILSATTAVTDRVTLFDTVGAAYNAAGVYARFYLRRYAT